MAMAMGIALVIVIYMTDGNIDSVVIFSIFISAPPTIATDRNKGRIVGIITLLVIAMSTLYFFPTLCLPLKI